VSDSTEDKTAVGAGAGALQLMADAQLVEQVMGGNRSFFDELIRRHQRRAHAVSYRLLGNSHDAAEVTQEAFLKAYQSIKTLENPERFGGWLMRIVSNLSLNRRRSRRKSVQLPVDDVFGGSSGDAQLGTALAEDPYEQLAGKELGDRLREAIERLPEKQRLAIEMFTVQQMPQKDVAVAMDCSVEAVKWHVFEGRRRLREMLKDLLAEQ